MVRGAPVMPGYWKNPKARPRPRDGWLMTGDVGRLDGDGYLTLADRSKDVIISGGTNIYPREVEEVLLTHRMCTRSRSSGVPSPNGARMSWPSSWPHPGARWTPPRSTPIA
jgi:long-chain acyl-CoA synthetase